MNKQKTYYYFEQNLRYYELFEEDEIPLITDSCEILEELIDEYQKTRDLFEKLNALVEDVIKRRVKARALPLILLDFYNYKSDMYGKG